MAFISLFLIVGGVITALCIAVDVRHRPQPMKVMNITWPVTK
ncbi:hypothetical protein [Pantoea sp.]|nr:hypothetical protein [Pantoea sp.]